MWIPPTPIITHAIRPLIGVAIGTAKQRVAQPPHRSWIATRWDRRIAAGAATCSFLFTLAVIVITGTLALVHSPGADVAFGEFDASMAPSMCARLNRRANSAIVNLNVGGQDVKLLLVLDQVVMPGTHVRLFSKRLLRSTSMVCEPGFYDSEYTQECTDFLLVHRNSSSKQSYERVPFLFQNQDVQTSLGNVATRLGLDGTYYLQRNQDVYLTTNMICVRPNTANDTTATTNTTGGRTSQLAFDVWEDGHLRTATTALKTYAPTASAPAAGCALQEEDASGEASGEAHTTAAVVDLFPVRASEETHSWLALSTVVLYSADSSTIDTRRSIVELGNLCIEYLGDTSRMRHDAQTHLAACTFANTCRDAPSLPYRRLATHKLWISIRQTNGVLRAEHERALTRLPNILAYDEAVWEEATRLFVMLLMAAVVFVRGSQNAVNPKYTLLTAIQKVRCSDSRSQRLVKIDWVLKTKTVEVFVDVCITLCALGARIGVLSIRYETFRADRNGVILSYEVVGIVASSIHFLSRYLLPINLTVEAPLTKLAGPMSIVDVASAVLLTFADAPLLGANDGRFSSIGRLLIAVLIAISVFSRCLFAASACALLAVTVSNSDNRAVHPPRGALLLGCALWIIQAASSCASLALIFVNPVSYHLVRSQPGDVGVVKYAVFSGLLVASMPTLTKTALRVLQTDSLDHCQKSK